MPTVTPVTAPGYVVFAGFLGDTPVFASGEGTVTFGTAGRTEKPHGGILAAVRDLDGRTLVTGGDDGRVLRITEDGTVTPLAEKGRKWIDQLATGPGGAVAFASGRTVWVREASGKEHELTRPRAVGGLAFFPKGLRVAIAGYNGVGLWFPGTTAAPQELEWKGSHIAVTLSPDGANVVTSMQENALHGWRLKDGQHMRMSGYPVKVKSLSWSAKGRFLASSGAGASVCWPFHFKDGPMGKRPLELGPRQELVTQVACHPSEEIAAIGYDDGMILLVRFGDGEEVLLRRPGDGPISALGWNRTGLELAFGTETGAAGVVDLAG
ncbi:WD40 repeat domain-containing protein [Chthonobacter rhizosphaerae]|uniref:WD40 repeat domain-containing protein n=1 Tax=Chthonobacter rhizosphaerae TaxID=2735553 RepID=UPI0015EE9DCF|nr:WD40 repeat domain-containing protein [Chthonobacter rhizosphaerae]